MWTWELKGNAGSFKAGDDRVKVPRKKYNLGELQSALVGLNGCDRRWMRSKESG